MNKLCLKLRQEERSKCLGSSVGLDLQGSVEVSRQELIISLDCFRPQVDLKSKYGKGR